MHADYCRRRPTFKIKGGAAIAARHTDIIRKP
jgi:hypothetical protein